jgi:hypothetical protein
MGIDMANKKDKADIQKAQVLSKMMEKSKKWHK